MTSVVLVGIIVLCLLGCLGDGLGIFLVFVNSPVEDIVVLETFSDKQITEDLTKVGVIRLIIETEGPGVVQVDGEFVRKSTAKDFGGSGHFFLHDAVILLFLRGRFESLPWEGAAAEVEHHVAKRFHIIAARLL